MPKEKRIIIECDVSLPTYKDLVEISKKEEVPLSLLCSYAVADFVVFFKNQGVSDGSDPADPEAARAAS